MKNVKFKSKNVIYRYFIAFSILFFITQNAFTQSEPALFNTRTLDFKTWNTENKHISKLLIIGYPDDSITLLWHTAWFQIDSITDNRFLASSQTSDNIPYNLGEICISADSRFLALEYVTEGHPLIMVYDFRAIIESGIFAEVAEINPYPGLVWLQCWEGNVLKMSSDVNLLEMNEANNTFGSEMLDKEVEFIYNVENKKFTKK